MLKQPESPDRLCNDSCSRAVQTGRTVGAHVVLLALGERFDALAAQIDHAIEHGLEIAWETLEEFGCINAAIVATPAPTMQGLYVKARAGCWALLGDFDSVDHPPAAHEWPSQ